MNLHLGLGRNHYYIGIWPRGSFVDGFSWLDYGIITELTHRRWGLWFE